MSRDRSGLVDVADLRRHLGERRDVALSVTHDGLVVGSSRVEPADLLAVSATLESISEGVTVVGEVNTHWHGACRRCLDDVEGDLVAPVSEIFSDRPVDGETYPIGNNQIDLAEMTRDAVLLELPTAPLCREDCPGPAADAFPVTVESDAAPAEPPRDPRWAALDVLRDLPAGGGSSDPQTS